MKLLVVEDDRKIKAETIDDVLASLGHECDWAQNQQEANGLLAANEYDLVLLDLQIPSRPGGKDSPEFGRNLLRQIRDRKGRDGVPVILMTAQYQHCVDLMTELQDIGIDGSIAKPFPTSGRTLAVVIEEVIDKHRRFRRVAKAKGREQPLAPFQGGVMKFGERHIDLCGETIARKSQKGYAWRILDILRQQNERGGFVRMDSVKLAAKLHPHLAQNTLIRAIKSLRERITTVMKDQLRQDCGPHDVIANGGHGYHLREWIAVGVCGAPQARLDATNSVRPAEGRHTSCGPRHAELNDRQRWVLCQLASGRKLVRRDVEAQFGISTRTAKRELGDLVEARTITFHPTPAPGHYRLV